MPNSSQLNLPLLGAVSFVVFALGMWITNGSKLPGLLQAWSDSSTSCLIATVSDGTTIRCGMERVRLADIDAPKPAGSPKCAGFRAVRSWCDHELAERSREALEALLDTGKVEILRQGEDQNGVTLAIVKVNGVNAGDYLIARGLARPTD